MANKNKLELQMYEWEEEMLNELVDKTKLNENTVLNMLTTFLLSEVTAMMNGTPSMLGSMTASVMQSRVNKDSKAVDEVVGAVIDAVAKDSSEEKEEV